MKILQINAVYGIGSTGRIVECIHKELRAQGHDSYVAWAIKKQNSIAETNEHFYRIGNDLDHKIHAVQRRVDLGQGFHSNRFTQKLLKYIDEIMPDVIHLHNMHSNYLNVPMLLRFCGQKDIPVVITLHDCWFFTAYCTHYQQYNCEQWKTGCKNCPATRKFFYRRIEQMFFEKQSAYGELNKLHVIGVSQWTAKDARCSKLLGKAATISHIYNWVNLDVWHSNKDREKIRNRYQIDSKKKIILGVAQGWDMQGIKGGRFFYEFTQKYHDKVEIVLVGQNINIPSIPGLHCIGFTSNQEELADLYTIANVYVTPSRQETFGLTVIEAMACGTPVVAYDNTALHELVCDSCGILVPDGNERLLSEAIWTVLNENKQKYSEACRRYVIENFDEKKQVVKYLDVYDKTRKNEVENYEVQNYS